jgi:phosphatidylglycerophosphate synthase
VAATGTRAGYIGAAVALYASFVLDCTDGQLARYSLNFSRIGSWLDATFDRAKEYAVYAGLALGSARHGDDVWLIAACAMALQTLRHHVDFAFHEGRRGAGAGVGPNARSNAGPDTETTAAKPVTAKPAAPAKTPLYWARKVVILPIGERWALIAVLTALTTPRTVFTVMLVWGVLAALYTTAGRVQRSLGTTTPASDEAALALYDMADISAAPSSERRRLKSKLGWLIPPAYHAFEYALAIAVAAQVHNALPVVFAYLAAVMYHHYDVVYRIRAGASAPRWVTYAGCFGFEGRVIVLAVVGVVLGGHKHAALTPVLIVLAAYLWVLFLGESGRFWARPAAPALPDDAV